MKPSTLNAALAYAVLDQIDAHPETWSQSVWDCGTAACFAGWAVRLAGGVADPNEDRIIGGPEELVGCSIGGAAIRALGHNGWTPRTARPSDEEWLFSPLNTRADLDRLVAQIFGPRPDGGEGGSVIGGES